MTYLEGARDAWEEHETRKLFALISIAESLERIATQLEERSRPVVVNQYSPADVVPKPLSVSEVYGALIDNA